MRELTLKDLRAVLGSSALNLIRRGADGSLRLSADHWRLDKVEPSRVIFRSLQRDAADAEQVLEVALSDVEQVTWDRLPKQEFRSQLRFHLRNGELWTFSGKLAEPPASPR
jgi:hypothetical protein